MVGCTKSQRKRTSLYIATCDRDLYYAVRCFYCFHIIRSYKAYFLHTNRSYIFRENFFFACNNDNLLEGSYPIHRQIWWTLMAKLGLRIFGSTSSISTWCKEFGQHEGERQAQHVGQSMTIYFISDIGKHNPLCCLPCPTSTLQHVIFQ